MRVLTAMLVGLLGVLVLTPLARRLAAALDIVDYPGRRKVHRKPVPRLGGVAVFLGWLSAVAVATQFPPDPGLVSTLAPVIGIAWLVVAFGVLDDWRDVPGKPKLLAQALLAALVYWAGMRIDRLTNPFGGELLFPEPLSFVLTVLWIVGMMNSVNLIDGLDGLASGVVAIASTGLIAAGLYVESQASVIILAALVGACVGFLRYNFHPAQLFLGDSGSQFLGFALAVAALVDQQYKAAAAVALLIPLTALALPIFDTGLAFVRRIQLRQSIFKADKYHLHHRLLRLGLSHTQVVLFLYLVCGYLSLMSFLFVLIKDRWAIVLLGLLTLGMFVAMQAFRFVELRFTAFRRRYRRTLRGS
jgi:UDP-GlcNAc:undecaprenyl-phosphate GlcNAc-1-phosphate transferase